MQRPSVAFHQSEITRMFRIATQLGVPDGDTKPDQFLYKVNTSAKPSRSGQRTPPALNVRHHRLRIRGRQSETCPRW